MSSTVCATFCGSSASSHPRGLPVSTEQKRQARVHTAPINMMVPVPAFQHSPMLGHLASSQTVARRCSRTVCRTSSKRRPAGIRARSHSGLRPAGMTAPLAAALTPSLIATKPCAVRYLCPLRTACGTTGMPLNLTIASLSCHLRGAGIVPLVEHRQPLRRADVEPGAVETLAGGAPVARRGPQQGRQPEDAGRATGEELGPVDPDARESQSLARRVDDPAIF